MKIKNTYIKVKGLDQKSKYLKQLVLQRPTVTLIILLAMLFKRVYRVEVSLEEYLAYTTEESEKVMVQQYAKKYGGDIKKGIAALANELSSGKN